MSARTSAGPAQPRSAGDVVECEVWSAAPSSHPGLVRLLDDADRRRADRLRRPADRASFVTAHALLRLLIAARVGVPPSELRFGARCLRCGDDHGKPRVTGPTGVPPVSFSLAHTDGRIAVAIADGVEVGVDVERVRDLTEWEVAALAATILSTDELTDFARLAHADRRWALTVWWARKEAVLKATGHGLTVPMTEVEVTCPDDVARVRSAATVPGGATSLHDLLPVGGHVASVAVLGTHVVRVVEPDAEDLLGRARWPGGWWV